MIELDTHDPAAEAKEAGLRYVTDRLRGIRREPDGDGFRYVRPNGEPVTDERTLARIKSLAIPPAWTDVWICPIVNGHLQATGRDAKGRKQYRYHPRWRQHRDETKYHRMIAFGERLPTIRTRVQQDLGQTGLSRERVLATVIRLLDETAIRVGNEEYVRENQHYGLTTLEHQHVEVTGTTMRFRFVGKAGKEVAVDVRDRRVARIVKKLEDLPGQELFQYLDESGARRGIESADVNAYLRDVAGQEFTAKDFRTWHGTVRAARVLHELGPAETKTATKQKITEAIKAVAGHLGNTPAVCKKCYVNPEVLLAYEDGTLARVFDRNLPDPVGLEPDETALLELLRERGGERSEQHQAA
jgi:DNA topoisomerase-1